MSRQYFADVLFDPPVVNPLASAITVLTETALFPVAAFTPIAIGDIRAGKVYQLKMGGIYSTSASASTLQITPRIGVSATAATNITLGASGAQTCPVSLSGAPWYLQFTLVIRTVGLPGTATCMGNGFFCGTGTVATAGTAHTFGFGGASASFDASVSEGLWIGWTLATNAGSCTPEWLVWQSLN